MASKKELEKQIKSLREDIDGLRTHIGFYAGAVSVHQRVMLIAKEIGIEKFERIFPTSPIFKIVKKKPEK